MLKKVVEIVSNSRRFYTPNKGFTLIEIILAMALSSLIILPLLSILNLSNRSCTSTEEKADLMLNGNFAINYIKQEVKSADTIISSDKIKNMNIKFPSNIGFVIRRDKDPYNKYHYITYHMTGNKLVRLACESTYEAYPKANDFSGYNEICEFVDNINNSKFDGENSIINLDFDFKNNCNLNLKSDIYIRCETDYLTPGD